MAHRRISNKTKSRFKKAIKEVVNNLSRKVLVYKQPSKSECPNCYFNKFDNCSTGKCKWGLSEALVKQAEWEANGNITVRYKYFVRGRCPICNGKGKLETIRKKWVNCLVTWNPQNRSDGNKLIYTPAGNEGAIAIRLKTDICHFNLFKNASKVFVDNIECKLSNEPTLRSLGGNDAILIVGLYSTENYDNIDSDENIKDYK